MALKTANLALRFLLELCVLIALGQWGLRTGQGSLAKIGLGLGAPLLAALMWGLFGAPAAPRRLALPGRLALNVVFFGAAVAALALTGRAALAWGFAALVLVNSILLYVWGQV